MPWSSKAYKSQDLKDLDDSMLGILEALIELPHWIKLVVEDICLGPITRAKSGLELGGQKV